MKISVIMPVYLGEYEGCATNREDKFIRAIHSFLQNKLTDAELIIVSDDCLIAKNIVNDKFLTEISAKRIKYIHTTPKSKLFSGELRSVGIKNANGKYICYLDSDDIIGDKHLDTIVSQIEAEKLDWAYYNDYVYTTNGFVTKTVFVQHESIGTSSIIHKNNKKLDWKGCNGYGHDWLFVQKLQKWSSKIGRAHV
jgi:glycosyltransferase involved in cell wall biosynthesis